MPLLSAQRSIDDPDDFIHRMPWNNFGPEDDDFLHNPGPGDGDIAARCFLGVSRRGIANSCTLVSMTLCVLLVFFSYPFSLLHSADLGNLGAANGTGQIPDLPDLFRLVDPATPSDALSWTKPIDDRSTYHIVFSDEFETPGRTFWPGDDPFWEAVDIYYTATGDFEWYSPEAVNTSDGFLNILLEESPSHGRNFRSGMVQSWNKFCFQGGYIETSVILPGSTNMSSLWPGVWMMGNLGRPGFLSSTHGMWPYTYNGCDTGILANQTWLNKTGPQATLDTLQKSGTPLSYLDGMRTPSCTCEGEDHPGPSVEVSRGAPELDVFEVWSGNGVATASQSLQVAPFDADYNWTRWTDATILYQNATTYNTYVGGPYQESVSGITYLPNEAFERTGARPTTFGLDYEPDWNGDGGGYVTWYVDGKPTWTLTAAAVPARPAQEIGPRLIPAEPLSIVMNLGVSTNWGWISWETLSFPVSLRIDYVRIYQRDGGVDRISCDPLDHPTARYIEEHLDVYSNPNLTVFPEEQYGWPKNAMTHDCVTGQKRS